MQKSMWRWIFLIGVVAVGLTLAGCSSDSGGSSTTGPGNEDENFPANYAGSFRFDALPYSYPIEFTIYQGGAVSGHVNDTDDLGNYVNMTITGTLQNGQLAMTISGEYGPPSCAINGEINGTSGDNYASFSGRWTYHTCVGITFQGSWQASRI